MICRIKFGETEAGKFLSHLDMLRAWQRAISRSALPLAYSKGFNKHPKLSFSGALPVGLMSRGEYVDIEFEQAMDIAEITARLKKNLPPALEIYAAKELSKDDPTIMSLVERAEYQAQLRYDTQPDDVLLQKVAENILTREVLEVSRRKKDSRVDKIINIRPWSYSLTAEADVDAVILDFIVQNGNDGNVKPQEIIGLFTAEIGACDDINIVRKELYALKDGQMRTPLEV